MTVYRIQHDTQAIKLATEQLSLGYQQENIISGLDLSFPSQKVTAIIGPNGCGKSTLLSGLARVLKPRAGRVLLNGQAVHEMPTKKVAQLLALLPQEAHAPQGMTVRELVRFGRQPHQGLWQRWTPEDQRIVDEAIALAALEDLADRPLDSMSGGQRQRAWIAMTIAQDTPLLLLDEPTSALDLGHQIEVFELIRTLTEHGKTVVIVVHDIVTACRFADHVIAMKDGEVCAQGSPQSIITTGLLERLYGVRCKVLKDPYNGTIMLADVCSVAKGDCARQVA